MPPNDPRPFRDRTSLFNEPTRSQVDTKTECLPPLIKRASLRYRYDRLRRDPNVLSRRLDLPKVLDLHNDGDQSDRRRVTRRFRLQTPAVGILWTKRSTLLGQRQAGTRDGRPEAQSGDGVSGTDPRRRQGREESQRQTTASSTHRVSPFSPRVNSTNTTRRSLNLLNPFFTTQILHEQDPFATPDKAARLLSLIPDKTLTAALSKKWDSQPSRPSSQKWSDIDSVASAGHLSTLSPKQLVDVKQDIRLEYTYPRLDAEVSKKLNHLLKSPFVIHPGTGRVCVPIDVRRVEDFDPLGVPTVGELLAEIDAWKGEEGDGDAKVQDWQKTSLKPYVEYFRRFVDALIKDESAAAKRGREEDGGLDF